MRIFISISTFKYILFRECPSLGEVRGYKYVVKYLYDYFNNIQVTEKGLIKKISKIQIYSIQQYFKRCCKYEYQDLSNIELFEFILEHEQIEADTLLVNVYQDIILADKEPNRIDNEAFKEYRRRIGKGKIGELRKCASSTWDYSK